MAKRAWRPVDASILNAGMRLPARRRAACNRLLLWTAPAFAATAPRTPLHWVYRTPPSLFSSRLSRICASPRCRIISAQLAACLAPPRQVAHTHIHTHIRTHTRTPHLAHYTCTRSRRRISRKWHTALRVPAHSLSYPAPLYLRALALFSTGRVAAAKRGRAALRTRTPQALAAGYVATGMAGQQKRARHGMSSQATHAHLCRTYLPALQ